MFDFDHRIDEGLGNKVREKFKEHKVEDIAEDICTLTAEDIESMMSEMIDGFKSKERISEFDPNNPSEDAISVSKDLGNTVVTSQVMISLWAPYKRFMNNEEDFNGKVLSIPRLSVDNPFLALATYIGKTDDKGFISPYLYVKNSRKTAIVGIDLQEKSTNTARVKTFLMMAKHFFKNRRKISKELDALYLDICQPAKEPFIFWPVNGMFPQVDFKQDPRGVKLNGKMVDFLRRLLAEVGLKINEDAYGILEF